MQSHPPIFIVNLERDTEKKAHMERLCQAHSLDFQFVPAVDGKRLEQSYVNGIYDEKKALKIFGRKLSRGELGCTLSHISIYKTIIENNLERAIIFEDDIEIEKNFHTVLDSVSNLPGHTDIVLLGHYSKVVGEVETPCSLKYQQKLAPDIKLVRLTRLAYGTHAYLITLSGAMKMLDCIFPIYKPIDHYTGSDLHANLYAIRPRPVRLHHLLGQNSTISRDRAEQRENRNIFADTKSRPSGIRHSLGRLIRYGKIRKQLREYYAKFRPLRKY